MCHVSDVELFDLVDTQTSSPNTCVWIGSLLDVLRVVVKSCSMRVHLEYVNFDLGLCKKRGGASCVVVCSLLPQFLDSKNLASHQWKGMCNLVRHLNSNGCQLISKIWDTCEYGIDSLQKGTTHAGSQIDVKTIFCYCEVAVAVFSLVYLH